MAGKKGREVAFLRWPKYKNLYMQAFEKMLKERFRRGKMEGYLRIGTTATDVFNWWMEYDILPGQMEMEDFLEEYGDE